MPGLRGDQDGSRHKGNLYTRSNSPCWELRNWRLKASSLTCYADEASDEPVATLDLRGASTHDVKLQSAGRQMHSSAIILKAFQQDLQPADGSSGASSSGSSSSDEASSPRRPAEYILAAEDGITHSTWQRHLSKAIAGADQAAASNRKLSLARKRGRGSSVLGPSPLVIMQLCGTGQEFGKHLLQKFKAARRLFEEGLRDLTAVADKARLGQRGLYEVNNLLLTISRTLSDAHCPENQSETDAEALSLCRDWISGLQAFVMELDQQVETLLQREGLNQLPSNWCTLAQNSVMQIRDIEEAMQFGHMQWRKLHAAKVAGSCGAGTGTPVRPLRCATTLRSAMPYNGYWARATAI